jgi:transposase, IS30 family
MQLLGRHVWACPISHRGLAPGGKWGKCPDIYLPTKVSKYMGHLTTEQRYTIEAMKKQGHSQKDIADAIGKCKSVVSRELGRNRDLRSGEYRSGLAQRKYENRQKEKPRHKKLTPDILANVVKGLSDKLSPEQITGRAKLENVPCVSHERIYQHVWEDKKRGGELYLNLRHKAKRYRKRGALKDKRGIIKGKVPIEERPAVVGERDRPGDLEIDTIIGKGRKGAILTINDRANGRVKVRKLEGKDAEKLAEKAIEALQDWKGDLHTITADNGKEFASHQKIAEGLGIDFYFANPYSSWERGSNENLNGLIRQYIPKKTDFDTVSEEYVQFVEDELNNRPRKRLDYKTPNEFYQLHKVAFAT